MANLLKYDVCVVTGDKPNKAGHFYQRVGSAAIDDGRIVVRFNLSIVTSEFVLFSKDTEAHFSKGRSFSVSICTKLQDGEPETKVLVGGAWDNGKAINVRLNLDFAMTEYAFFLEQKTATKQQTNSDR